MKKNNTVKGCEFPKQSKLANEALNANFHDSYQVYNVPDNIDVLDVYFLMVNNTPKWINNLLSLRNKTMLFVGVKDVGNLGGLNQIKYADRTNVVGAKLDIFVIDSFSKDEMILILNDKHLDIKMSILRIKESIPNENCIAVSTLVVFNNLIGRFYMGLIRPFHEIIVKRLMKNINPL